MPFFIILGSLFTLATAYLLGGILTHGVERPRSLQLAVGVPVLSLLVFALFVLRIGNVYTFVAVGVAALAGYSPFLRNEKRWDSSDWKDGLDRITAALTFVVLGAFAVFYLANAMVPEVQPDASSYHLGLVSEWVRLGRFPNRVGFFEMLPQGPEMLFAVAFSIGRHSAAKMVEFGLLMATVPLMFATGRRLNLPAWATAGAVVLYFCSPVVGITGTSAYTEAALVLSTLAAFYSVLAWSEERKPAWLVAAGLTAGFCYGVKMPGLVVVPLAMAFVAVKSRCLRPAVILGLSAATIVAPWMARNWVMSGNPVAPFLNSVFPNPYFHLWTEQILTRNMRSYAISPAQLPLELTVRGARLGGLIGPVFLLVPLGLLALRRREGRLLWAAGVLLAVPWFLNKGTRFLLPSLPFLALAFTMALTRPLVWACMVLHAVSCWPQAIDRWSREPYAWRLREFPWKAALRLEPADQFLSARSWGYGLAGLINSHVPPKEKVLDMVGVASAYSAADVSAFWTTADAERAFGALWTAVNPNLAEISATFPERELSAVKLVQDGSGAGLWSIHEMRIDNGDRPVLPVKFLARPNTWEAQYAFDWNPVSRWTTWEAMRKDMQIEGRFEAPARVTRVSAIVDLADAGSRPVFYGRNARGDWEVLDGIAGPVAVKPAGLKPLATRLLRETGFRWILVQDNPAVMLETSLVKESREWGLKATAQYGPVWLLHVE